MRIVFPGRNSIKTVSNEEQMISEDKCASIFSRQMEATAFILPAFFFSTLTNSWAFFCLRYLLFCVLWYDVMNEQTTKKMRPRQSSDVTVLYLDFLSYQTSFYYTWFSMKDYSNDFGNISFCFCVFPVVVVFFFFSLFDLYFLKTLLEFLFSCCSNE